MQSQVLVEILGMGCARCHYLEERVRRVVEKYRLEVVVRKVADMDRIAASGILSLPGLVINGHMMTAGNIPSDQQLISWIREAEGKPAGQMSG